MPPRMIPAVHHSTVLRCRRRARAPVSRSRTPAAAGPGRGRSRPAPRSRRPTRISATAARPAVAPSDSSSGHHRSPAYGRVFCAQPIGEAHDAAPSPTSPMARTTNDPASTMPAMPDAARAVSTTWAVAAVSVANSAPVAAKPAPISTEPPAGRPIATRPAATIAPVRTSIPNATPSAASTGARRPIGAARSSSRRPDSSSPRVRRDTISNDINATATAPRATIWKAT